MARKAAGKKRGPKKGYKQSPAHIAKRKKALRAAWKAGKFKNRRRRKASARSKVKRTKRRREAPGSRIRRRKSYALIERAKRGRKSRRRS